MSKFKELPPDLQSAILTRRKLVVLSLSNFLGREMGRDCETFTGDDIRQVRAIGIIVRFKGTQLCSLIPWSRVAEFEYHVRDPLMWFPGEVHEHPNAEQ